MRRDNYEYKKVQPKNNASQFTLRTRSLRPHFARECFILVRQCEPQVAKSTPRKKSLLRQRRATTVHWAPPDLSTDLLRRFCTIPTASYFKVIKRFRKNTRVWLLLVSERAISFCLQKLLTIFLRSVMCSAAYFNFGELKNNYFMILLQKKCK